MTRSLTEKIRRLFWMRDILALKRRLIELNNIDELKKFFKWSAPFEIDEPFVYEFDGELDLNQRRIRDAEVLACVARNSAPTRCLEIGTGAGLLTSIIARNAPSAEVYTLNADPQEIFEGKAGEFTTMALKREQIGSYYRAKGLKNVQQIFANSLTWQPTIGPIELAFVDGCHDFDFVVNDTRKVLKLAKPGSFILWHDFNPHLFIQYNWIFNVCAAVGYLTRTNEIPGPIFYLKDSWIGLTRLP